MVKIKKKPKQHNPVLVDQVLDIFGLENAHLNSKAHLTKLHKVIVDATVGLGGHSVKIINSGCHRRILSLSLPLLLNKTIQFYKKLPWSAFWSAF